MISLKLAVVSFEVKLLLSLLSSIKSSRSLHEFSFHATEAPAEAWQNSDCFSQLYLSALGETRQDSVIRSISLSMGRTDLEQPWEFLGPLQKRVLKGMANNYELCKVSLSPLTSSEEARKALNNQLQLLCHRNQGSKAA